MTAWDAAEKLRQTAEAHLKTSEPTSLSIDAKALPRLFHELHVHQIELEMQNSELQQTRTELETALALYTELYDFAPVGYLTLDAEGQISKINLTAATLLGVERRNLLQKRLVSFVIRDDQVRWHSHLQALTCNDGKSSADFELQRGDGSHCHVQVDCLRHDAFDAATALVSSHEVRISLIDITQRKAVEAERAILDQALQDKNVELERATSVAEKANLAKSEFLSSMSHELRTPLGAILGFAQLLESGTPPPTAVQVRSIDQILKAGWYLLELINEILDLALIESGKLSLSLEPVALADVMRECETMVESQAEQRGVTVRFAHPESPILIFADRTRVKQVLINLLSNAIKYNTVGGSVVVDWAMNGAMDSVDAHPDTIRIKVSDTGGGLTPEQLRQLFQPFNRLGQSGGDKQGTGIGLVVCKRLVELMGGIIGVESTIGQGSVFWIDLNLVGGSRAAAGALEPALSLAPTQVAAPLSTLLYIEDSPANLMLVKDLVARRPDIRLLTAMDGKQGIELARATLPDIILMDINLPGISGVEALAILKKDPATAHIPVLAISANAIPHDIEKGLEAGFFRYLTKPIKVKEFMITLDEALSFSKQAPSGETR